MESPNLVPRMSVGKARRYGVRQLNTSVLLRVKEVHTTPIAITFVHSPVLVSFVWFALLNYGTHSRFKGLNAGGMAAELRHGDDRRTLRDDTSKERRKRVFVSCYQLGFMLQHGVMLESSLLPPDSWQKGRQDHCRPKWKEEKGGMRCRHFLVGL